MITNTIPLSLVHVIVADKYHIFSTESIFVYEK